MTWDWWINSDGGLLARIGIGVTILAAMALWELLRRGRQARRWREYLFLAACVGVALGYGITNDQITASLSWEYFIHGKGLDDNLDPRSIAFRWEVAKVGMKATWSAGLLIGVALLIANNPRRDRGRLNERELFRYLPLVLGITIGSAVIGGLMGALGAFVPFSEDFRILVAEDALRPRRFMTVFGVHLGGYLGGLVGTVLAILLVLRRRERMRLGDSLHTRGTHLPERAPVPTS